MKDFLNYFFVPCVGMKATKFAHGAEVAKISIVNEFGWVELGHSVGDDLEQGFALCVAGVAQTGVGSGEVCVVVSRMAAEFKGALRG